MKMPWTNQHGAAKVVVVCAMVLLVSGGLCGLQLVVFNAQPRWINHFADFLLAMGYIEVAAMIFSVVVGFIALLVWGIQAIFKRSHRD